jgi:hypothetical protein
VPEVLVEFVPDFTKLNTALDELVNKGVLTKSFADSFRAAQRPVDELANQIKNKLGNSIEDVGEVTEKMVATLVEDLMLGMEDALKEAGISLDEFKKKLNDPKPIQTQQKLKGELGRIRNEMAALDVAGKKSSQQYRDLAMQAGRYENALKNATQSMQVFSAESRGLSIAVNAAQGLASAFSVGAGAAQLLGRSGKEFEETLLRLNAVMAISNGLAQLQQILSKQNVLVRAVESAQLRLQNAHIALNTAATSKNILVKGAATLAQKALNVAMKASPLGIVTTGLTLLAGAFAFMGSKAKDAEQNVELLNAQLENQKRIIDDLTSDVQFATSVALENAKQRGASEQELFKIKQDGYQKEVELVTKSNRENIERINNELGGNRKIGQSLEELQALRNRLNLVDIALGKGTDERTNRILALLDAQIAGERKFQGLNQKIVLEQEQFETDAADKARERQKKALDEARAREQQRLNDVKARIQAQLLAEDEGTEAFVKLQVKLAEAEKNIGLFNAKSLAERELAIATFLSNVDDLTTAFWAGEEKKALESQIASLRVSLANINLSAQERERLTVSLMEKQRQLEIDAANGNATAIKEINARIDGEIRDARLQIKQETLDRELEMEEAMQHRRKSALTKSMNDEDASAKSRVAAAQSLLAMEVDTIDRRAIALQDFYNAGLISEEQFGLQTQQLLNQRGDAYENFEQFKTDVTEAETEKRKKRFEEEFEKYAQMALDFVGSLNSLSAAFSDLRKQRLDDELENIKALRDANTITDKEYMERQKQINEAKRRQAREDAVREKSAALFTATVQGAVQIVKTLGNPPLMFLTIALVAAQIAAIAAKPIPKFGRGTKSAPKGLAEIGETGAELVETKRGMFVAKDPQLVWFEGGERVYSPQETKAKLPQLNETLIQYVDVAGSRSSSIDYDKLGKAIGQEISKHPRNIISLDEDGFTHHLEQKGSITKYKNKRYTFND